MTIDETNNVVVAYGAALQRNALQLATDGPTKEAIREFVLLLALGRSMAHFAKIEGFSPEVLETRILNEMDILPRRTISAVMTGVLLYTPPPKDQLREELRGVAGAVLDILEHELGQSLVEFLIKIVTTKSALLFNLEELTSKVRNKWWWNIIKLVSSIAAKFLIK